MLRHPLCLALIRRKWQNYGRYLYFTGLFFYLIFLALLTSYALLTPNATHVTYNSSDFCRDPTLRSTVTEISPKTPFFIVCQVGIIVIVLFNSLMELVQFYRVIKFLILTKPEFTTNYCSPVAGTSNGRICLTG